MATPWTLTCALLFLLNLFLLTLVMQWNSGFPFVGWPSFRMFFNGREKAAAIFSHVLAILHVYFNSCERGAPVWVMSSWAVFVAKPFT
jgi:hypothetical protein